MGSREIVVGRASRWSEAGRPGVEWFMEVEERGGGNLGGIEEISSRDIVLILEH